MLSACFQHVSSMFQGLSRSRGSLSQSLDRQAAKGYLAEAKKEIGKLISKAQILAPRLFDVLRRWMAC